jgi:DNA-binding HxlR family transcriptional regulator
VTEFRYAQFCPLARATELLGERWTLLVVRDLLTGPLRFSDLRSRLRGISSSVLADRLERLEGRGLVAQRELPAPAASIVYELTEAGRALRPVMVELARWGLRFLLPPNPNDHTEPAWATLGLSLFARSGPTPPCSFEVHVLAEGRESHAFVRGGPEGTQVTDSGTAPDAVLRGEGMTLLGLMAGLLDADAAVGAGVEIEGDRAAVARFAELFQVSDRGDPASPPNPHLQQGET